MNSEGTPSLPGEADTRKVLPVRFRREADGMPGIDPLRGTLGSKRPREYYLRGLTAVFHPGVPLPGPLRVPQEFSGAEVLLLHPGPNVVEVMHLATRFPEIKCLHIVDSSESNLDAIRSALEKEAASRQLPELAGYVTDLRCLPEALAGRCDLVVEVNVVDPKSNKFFRQDVVQQISRVLKLGGLFYSAGETVRWTEDVIPLSLARVSLPADILARSGYSDALPRPLFYLKHLPDVPALMAEEGTLREWWRRAMELIGQGRQDAAGAAVQAPFVPRVEDARGEPNVAPWDFLITKPAVRRPAMSWTPDAGDHFGNLTLGALLQHNRQTGMYVFPVREYPDVVLKLMRPFEGDIPDDPMEWDRLRKSKTLKRENQALKLLKGVRFIPQRMAHGYDPTTGWYAIVVEYEKSGSLKDFIHWQYNRLRRHHETPEDVEQVLEPVLKLLASLSIVHDKGLVHQDLKPAHVFLRPDCPEAVLIDWGLARKVDEPLSEERRSLSWLHAAPERADMDVLTCAGVHQDLYAVGVMLLQLGSDLNLNEQPRLLFDYFLQHGHMPSSAKFESMLRPHWRWAAPVIARAVSSRKDVPGYAHHRYTSAREMAEDISGHAQKVRLAS
ncbi:MAG: protein kinase [Verrucomicrobia bacterium]|nr:protein kinase [Verrucomicrobiota bacterium]